MGVEYWIYCLNHKEALLLGKGFDMLLGEEYQHNQYRLKETGIKELYEIWSEFNPPRGKIAHDNFILNLLHDFMKKHNECEISLCTDLYDEIWYDVDTGNPLPGWTERLGWEEYRNLKK